MFWDNGASRRAWQRNASDYARVYLDTGLLTRPGRVVDKLPPWVEGFVARHHLVAQICVANDAGGRFDGVMLHALLTHPADEARVTRELVAMVRDTPFAGVNIDFESAEGRDRFRFARFLARLQAALQPLGKSLSVSLPAETAADATAPWHRAYSYRLIAPHVHQILVMAYDHAYQGGPPGPIAPSGWVRQVLAFATRHVPRALLTLGLPVYGYNWVTRPPYPSTEESLPAIDAWLRAHPAVTPRWDATAGVPYFVYPSGTNDHYVAYENAASTKATLRLAGAFGIPAVFTWYVGSEDPAVGRTLLAGTRRGGRG